MLFRGQPTRRVRTWLRERAEFETNNIIRTSSVRIAARGARATDHTAAWKSVGVLRNAAAAAAVGRGRGRVYVVPTAMEPRLDG